MFHRKKWFEDDQSNLSFRSSASKQAGKWSSGAFLFLSSRRRFLLVPLLVSLFYFNIRLLHTENNIRASRESISTKIERRAVVAKNTSSNVEVEVSEVAENITPLSTDQGKKPRVAYTTLSYGDDLCPALTSAFIMHDVLSNHNDTNSRYDIDVIIMRVGDPIPHQRIPVGVIQRAVKQAKAKGNYQWTHTYAKFWIKDWDEYDVVIFLDSDVMLLNPLNVLIDKARDSPDSIIVPSAYWISNDLAMTGTFALSPGAVIHKIFDTVLKGKDYGTGDGEMDWFNAKFKRSSSLTFVSGLYTLLCGEFFPGDGIFNYWGEKLNLSPNEMLKTAPLVHFIATWKPWGRGIETAEGGVTTELKLIYKRWNEASKKACKKISP